MSMRRVTAVLLIGVAGSMAVVSCGSDRVATVDITHFRPTTAMDQPIQMDKDGSPTPRLRWGTADQLILTTWGSGSCPLLPTSVTLENAHRITITIGLASDDGPCSADLAPTNSVIVAPHGLDANQPTIARIQSNDVALSSRN